jgi:hypothetical protein
MTRQGLGEKGDATILEVLAAGGRRLALETRGRGDSGDECILDDIHRSKPVAAPRKVLSIVWSNLNRTKIDVLLRL